MSKISTIIDTGFFTLSMAGIVLMLIGAHYTPTNLENLRMIMVSMPFLLSGLVLTIVGAMGLQR